MKPTTVTSTALDDEAHDRVVRHLPVARRIAARYAGRGIAADDLEQVAALGLVLAAQRYDDSRGDAFLSYAVPTITGELRRHFRDRGWSVRPPRRLQEAQHRLWEVEPELTQRLGRTPTIDELAAEAGVDAADAREAQTVDGCFHAHSLDHPHQPDVVAITGAYGSADEFRRAEDTIDVGTAIAGLPEADREILRLRFGECLTQAQIGRRTGVTQAQVSRTLARILGQLRAKFVARDEPTGAAAERLERKAS